MQWLRKYCHWLHTQWPAGSSPDGSPRYWKLRTWLLGGLFLLFCCFLYHWKSYNEVWPLYQLFELNNWFPFNIETLFIALGHHVDDAASTRPNILFTLRASMSRPGFYYALIYSICVTVFGFRRIHRHRTSYVKVQTYTLMLIQIVLLFLLPEIVLPWLGNNGWFESGTNGGRIADLFFEASDSLGYERAYWRMYGFVLAWPLFVWNVFADQPYVGWLFVSILQTFVLIPLLVRKWGKGAYCGWICSCGALAETLGDQHRRKMPHGPLWNRVNLLGQGILLVAFVLLGLRILGWIWPSSGFGSFFTVLFREAPYVHYSWFVDVFLSGVLGVGLYFWFSGRTWCRFACPLAALMHIYARFSRFRIFVDRQKCIQCGECTATCHQGIDVKGFVEMNQPMRDPECVRCGSCVEICPTEVLKLGEIDPSVDVGYKLDSLSARAP